MDCVVYLDQREHSNRGIEMLCPGLDDLVHLKGLFLFYTHTAFH